MSQYYNIKGSQNRVSCQVPTPVIFSSRIMKKTLDKFDSLCYNEYNRGGVCLRGRRSPSKRRGGRRNNRGMSHFWEQRGYFVPKSGNKEGILYPKVGTTPVKT